MRQQQVGLQHQNMDGARRRRHLAALTQTYFGVADRSAQDHVDGPTRGGEIHTKEESFSVSAWGASSVIVIVPTVGPVVLGAYFTMIEHEPEAATDVTHVFVWEKSPLTLTSVMAIGAEPLLLRLTL